MMCACLVEWIVEGTRAGHVFEAFSSGTFLSVAVWCIHVAYVLLFGCVFGWWWPHGLLIFVLWNPTTSQWSCECIRCDDYDDNSLTTKSPLHGQNWTVSGTKCSKNSSHGYFVKCGCILVSGVIFLFPGLLMAVWGEKKDTWEAVPTWFHFVKTQSAGCGSRVQVKVLVNDTHTRRTTVDDSFQLLPQSFGSET